MLLYKDKNSSNAGLHEKENKVTLPCEII